jgi:hypothetical protein
MHLINYFSFFKSGNGMLFLFEGVDNFVHKR